MRFRLLLLQLSPRHGAVQVDDPVGHLSLVGVRDHADEAIYGLPALLILDPEGSLGHQRSLAVQELGGPGGQLVPGGAELLAVGVHADGVAAAFADIRMSLEGAQGLDDPVGELLNQGFGGDGLGGDDLAGSDNLTRARHVGKGHDSSAAGWMGDGS